MIVATELEKATVDLIVVLDAEERVAGFFVRPRKPESPPWEAPPYAPPGSFVEEEVVIGEGEW